MTYRIHAACVAAIAALASPDALARPVTYPGGEMAMIEHKDGATALEFVHTFNQRFGLGWHSEWDNDGDWQFHGPMAAGLAKRWNNPDSQGNIFWMAGAGLAADDVAAWGDDPKAAGYVALEADWENRRVYTQYQARAFWADDIDRTLSQRARFGIAPYVAEAGALHTWAILQIDHEPEREHPLSVSPVVRLFKGPLLAEAGASLRGDAFASVMFYF